MSLPDALRQQARNNAALGSPFTARILRLLADRLRPGTPLTDRLFDWPGDIGPHGASVPLRLLGGLHALVLTGAAPRLVAAFPPNPAPDEAGLWAAIDTALTGHAGFLDRWLDSPPQTNEVRRAAAFIAAGHWLTRRIPLPMVLSELGASGGLNLNWDRYALQLPGQRYGPPDPALTLCPGWTGPLPPPAPPRVEERRGVDLNPLDPQDPDDALRLTAYLWADQPERLARTRAAMALPPASVDRGDAAPWLGQRLARPRPGRLHLVFHSIAWQYFPPAVQAACRRHLARAGERATEAAPLAHLSMEADGGKGGKPGKGAGLTLTLWPGARKFDLGRVDFHGRWLNWQAG